VIKVMDPPGSRAWMRAAAEFAAMELPI